MIVKILITLVCIFWSTLSIPFSCTGVLDPRLTYPLCKPRPVQKSRLNHKFRPLWDLSKVVVSNSRLIIHSIRKWIFEMKFYFPRGWFYTAQSCVYKSCRFELSINTPRVLKCLEKSQTMKYISTVIKYWL